MVTDAYAHPLQNGLMYIRTDVAAAIAGTRRIRSGSRSTTASLSPKATHWCCEGFAIDPQNVNVVYYAGGISRYGRNGAIFKSTDKGNTRTQLTGINVLMDGNGDLRWADSRLVVVSPFNSNVILFGSRSGGLWRSTNGGTNWTAGHDSSQRRVRIRRAIAGLRSGASGVAYAFVNLNGGSSGGTVYASSDNGAN